MGLKKFLAERLINSIVAAIFTPALIVAFLTGVYSLIKNISWIDALYSIPLIAWIILVILVIIWICIVAIRKKMDYTGSYVVIRPPNGWEDLTPRKDHFKVKWQVRTPSLGPTILQNPFDLLKERKLYVDPIPRCPKCETKLDISKNSLWYTWYCPHCGFKKRTWESNIKIVKQVQNIVDREAQVAREKGIPIIDNH